MSDDDRDIDVESDEGEEYGTRQPSVQRHTSGNQYYSQAEKRAHHNALERKRRDHIKDSFNSLRDTVPALDGEKVASRAQILKRAAEYIMLMRTKTSKRQRSIDKLKYQNNLLEAQINQLENNRAAGSFVLEEDERELSYNDSDNDSDDDSDDDTSDEEMPVQKRTKKVKTAQH